MSTRKGLSREKREQREHRVARLREDVKAKEGRDQEQRGRKGMGRTGNEKKGAGREKRAAHEPDLGVVVSSHLRRRRCVDDDGPSHAMPKPMMPMPVAGALLRSLRARSLPRIEEEVGRNNAIQ